MDLKISGNKIKKEIEKIRNIKDLDRAWQKYLGKRGEVLKIFRDLKNLSRSDREKVGKKANELKVKIQALIKKRKSEIEKLKKEDKKSIDVTLPGKKISIGHLHLLSRVLEEIEEIFKTMGFQIVQGPEIESEWYNFDALNLPKDHPARDIWDTLWLKDPENKGKESKCLLRTHTSPVQIRYMEKHNPPFRIVAPGRIFRHEATDTTHDIQFYQLEGLMVGKNISLANLKAVLIDFFWNFFGKKVKARFRTGFFPFTEPSIEVDILGDVGKGKGREWLELLGAGMVHPNVLKAVGLNPKNWQGFAFGMGVDRLAMIKYKVDDIRLFYNGNLQFLKQF